MKRYLFALALAGCGGGGGETASGGPAAPTASTVSTSASTPGLKLAYSPDSRKVDKVGSADGAASPDGQKDVVITADVEGPAKALFVVAEGSVSANPRSCGCVASVDGAGRGEGGTSPTGDPQSFMSASRLRQMRVAPR